MSAGSFNWSDSVHWRMMQTVYKRFTDSKLDCPQYGRHWQQVGFQVSKSLLKKKRKDLFAKYIKTVNKLDKKSHMFLH